MRERLQFADEQIFGRSSRLCLKALYSHRASGPGDLSSDMRRAEDLQENPEPWQT